MYERVEELLRRPRFGQDETNTVLFLLPSGFPGDGMHVEKPGETRKRGRTTFRLPKTNNKRVSVEYRSLSPTKTNNIEIFNRPLFLPYPPLTSGRRQRRILENIPSTRNARHDGLIRVCIVRYVNDVEYGRCLTRGKKRGPLATFKKKKQRA